MANSGADKKTVQA